MPLHDVAEFSDQIIDNEEETKVDDTISEMENSIYSLALNCAENLMLRFPT
jgi:hypothetical protein